MKFSNVALYVTVLMGVGEYIILNAQVFCVCVQLGKFALGSDKIQLYYGQELPVTMVVGVS